MARGQPSTSARPNRISDETDADRLQAAIDNLADNVKVLTDIVDQIREDLSWLTRNGVSHQPLTVLVNRMPLLSGDEPREGSFEFSLLSPPVRDPTEETLSDDRLRSAVIDEIVDRLSEPLGHLAQEQLNVLLSVLDDSHRKILQAIRDPQSIKPAELRPPSPRPRKKGNAEAKPTAPSTSIAPLPPADPPPPRGKLF